MEVVGYADRFSVAPGETIRFYVSCQQPDYQADIVRLIHGDPNPKGPGFKEELVATPVSGEYPGRRQDIHTGSHIIVPDAPPLRLADGFTLYAWIYATTPQKGVQGILGKWSEAEGGYGLVLDQGGVLAAWLTDPAGRTQQVRINTPLRTAEWYFVAATFDAQSGQLAVYQEPLRTWPQDQTRATATATTQLQSIPTTQVDCVLAGLWQAGDDGASRVGRHLNGKLDRPGVFRRALSREELLSLQRGASPLAFGDDLVAAWDFSAEVASDTIIDTSPHGLHGRTVNMPARAMTGYNWSGQETDFRNTPHEYGAIHFHDDDLEDAGWQVDFELDAADHVSKRGVCRTPADRGWRRPYSVFCPSAKRPGHARILPSWLRPIVIWPMPTSNSPACRRPCFPIESRVSLHRTTATSERTVC